MKINIVEYKIVIAEDGYYTISGRFDLNEKKALKQLRKNPQVKKIIAEIQSKEQIKLNQIAKDVKMAKDVKTAKAAKQSLDLAAKQLLDLANFIATHKIVIFNRCKWLLKADDVKIHFIGGVIDIEPKGFNVDNLKVSDFKRELGEAPTGLKYPVYINIGRSNQIGYLRKIKTQ